MELIIVDGFLFFFVSILIYFIKLIRDYDCNLYKILELNISVNNNNYNNYSGNFVEYIYNGYRVF